MPVFYGPSRRARALRAPEKKKGRARCRLYVRPLTLLVVLALSASIPTSFSLWLMFSVLFLTLVFTFHPPLSAVLSLSTVRVVHLQKSGRLHNAESVLYDRDLRVSL